MATLQINPLDAAVRAIEPGCVVQVRCGRGVVSYRKIVTLLVPQGQVFVAMHDPLVKTEDHD